MGSQEIYLTQVGYQKLVEKLEYLKMVRRRELSKAIETARGFGDISENAEYEAAKEAQALNEKQINELEDKLARARIIENEDISNDEAFVGAIVLLQDLDTSQEISYMLVSEAEADYEEGKISLSSPVGKAILGHKVGDLIEIKVPAGTLRYKITKITR